MDIMCIYTKSFLVSLPMQRLCGLSTSLSAFYIGTGSSLTGNPLKGETPFETLILETARDISLPGRKRCRGCEVTLYARPSNLALKLNTAPAGESCIKLGGCVFYSLRPGYGRDLEHMTVWWRCERSRSEKTWTFTFPGV
jgi:hypothetical protein